MVNYTLKINKNIKKSKVLFDADIDKNIIKIISTDKYDYALIEVVEGTNVTYTILCDGYETISNTILMNKNYELTPNLILNKLVTLTINPTPSDAKVIITYNNQKYTQNSLEVKIGIPVSYNVSKINKQTFIDTIVLEKDTTINVELLDEIKNDGDIANYEKDYSDDLNKINTISKKEYESLTDEARSKYIKYTDLLNRIFGVDYNRTLSDCIVQLYWTLPIANKLVPFTNGTLGNFQTDFINYIAQLNTLLTAADSVGDKIKSLRKPLNKVGLGSLTDILTTGFGLIGGMAGIIYAMMNNPNIFIKTYAQQFADIDIQDIYNRTIGETIPNLDYLKGMVNRTYLPDNELKKTLLYQINEVGNAADLSLDVLNDLAKLKELVEVANSSEDAMQALLQNLSTMSLGWAISYLTDYIDKLRKDKDTIKYNANNNNLSQAYDVMRSNLDKIMNDMNEYYVNEDDLQKFNKAIDTRTSTQKIFSYENGYNEALNNALIGETEEQKQARLEKLKSEMENLGKDIAPYIFGYNQGWKDGNEQYNTNNETQIQIDSYRQGYIDGDAFGKDISAIVKNSLQIGNLVLFVDEDLHLHNPTNRYEPFGRIDNDIVYDFNYDMSENVIGNYDSVTNILHLNETRKEFRLPIDIYKKVGDTKISVGTYKQIYSNTNDSIKNLFQIDMFDGRTFVIKHTLGSSTYDVYQNNIKVGEYKNEQIINEYIDKKYLLRFDDGEIIINKDSNGNDLPISEVEYYYRTLGVEQIINEQIISDVAGYDINGDIILNLKDSINYSKYNSSYIDENGNYHFDWSNDEEHERIRYLNLSENNLFMVNRLYIYDTSAHTDKEEIINKDIYNINLMRVQRTPRINYVNPYYANGWEKGYNDKIDEQNRINELLQIEDDSKILGYNFAKENKTIEDVAKELDIHKDDVNYSYYSRGFIAGYNQYQSEYNSTYNKGWYIAYIPEDEQEEYMTKEDFLQQIISDYHLENLSQQELNINSYYTGANNGWDDALNPLIVEQRYKESYLDY